MPTLTFAPSKRPLRVGRRVHGGARTWSDARCPSGGGVSRSYAHRYLAETNQNPQPFTWTADPDAIIEKVRRAKQALKSIH